MGTHSFTAVISGCSMEPTLHGLQRMARCDQCESTMRFSEDEDLDDRPTACPRCGSQVAFMGGQAAETVNIQPIDWMNASVRRGEMVAVHDRERNRFEVKRVVGFPHESIQIINGDLWIDGRRFQKSISQFALLAIKVDCWSEIEGVQMADPSRSPMEECYQSFSLWPRTGEHLTPRPSPILDEYPSNAMESRELVAVRDIGVHLVLSRNSTEPARIEVRIWYEGAVRSLSLEISSTGVQILAPSFSSKMLPFHREPYSPSLTVAVVDGRLLVGTEGSGHALDIHECVFDSSTDKSSHCSASKPISLTILDGQVTIMQAFIVRDIHYRGGSQENEYVFPSVSGYCVLGDNVSNSSDSRDRWPDGVPRELIVGRIESIESLYSWTP
jgi:DNA-directed RNA polymerase subunit RPC12/RpoP